MTESTWLDTTKAAQALDIAPCTLKRRRDIDGGFLEAGKHYRLRHLQATAQFCGMWTLCGSYSTSEGCKHAKTSVRRHALNG